MVEVSAIMNARPLVPIQTDPDMPFLLTPSALLTQNSNFLVPPGDFGEKDLYKRQWMQVQNMANRFWNRWRAEYLQTLQPRRKWQDEQRNIQLGDLLLLRDAQAVITAIFPGQDEKVWKVELKVTKEGTIKKFFRPVSEIILLMGKEDSVQGTTITLWPFPSSCGKMDFVRPGMQKKLTCQTSRMQL
ncbi:hypothetical protein AALO_G00138730 [Alosa alosa]|uniref:DUF5641 domain-containing protein n=1 Tax=Alosa alosa TaxID=278164 RepID=A0AAV6GJL1_9TELE|nr:hypothetical protein AALO_G00138730 [Alosa alosa]